MEDLGPQPGLRDAFCQLGCPMQAAHTWDNITNDYANSGCREGWCLLSSFMHGLLFKDSALVTRETCKRTGLPLRTLHAALPGSGASGSAAIHVNQP